MLSCFYICIDRNEGIIMALDVSKVNFLQQAMQPQQAQQARTVQPTKAVGPSFGQLTGGGLASNNQSGGQSTVGVNTKIGIGDEMFLPAQAGRQAGTGKTYGFA